MKDLKGSRIVVTGGKGFLGSHVVRALEAEGAYPYSVSRSDGFDLTDEARAIAAVLLPRPGLVVHLAAPSDEAPHASALQDRLLMGLNVINACSMGGIKAVLVCRSGPPGSSEHAIREVLMAAGRAHRQQHGLEFVQIVPCDLYGPMDHFEDTLSSRFVPRILGGMARVKAKKGKTVTFSGNPKRPFRLLYAEDAAKAIVAACKLPGCDEPLELSGPETLPVEEIATVAARCMEFKGEVSWDTKVSDPWQRGSHDGEVAQEILGWRPEVKLERGLKSTLEWLASASQPK